MREAFGAFFQTAVRPPWMKAGAGAVRHDAVARRVLPLTHWTAYLDCMRAYLDERYDFPRRAAGRWNAGDGDGRRRLGDVPGRGAKLAHARSVPHAEVVRFAGVGHAVPFEAPLAFVRALGVGARKGLTTTALGRAGRTGIIARRASGVPCGALRSNT